MNHKRRAQRAQDFGRLHGPVRRVVGDAHVQRLAAADDVVQRAHGLLEGRFRVRPVVVEDVHVVKVHPLQALVEA